MAISGELVKHASCVSIGGNGVMLTGPSGSGKSDLALRLIDRGAKLISDDYINLSRKNDEIMLSGPTDIAGKIEVRSLGVFEIEYTSNIPLKLKVRLGDQVDRFPLDKQIETILGQPVTTIALNALTPSAPILVEMALQRQLEAGLHHD